MAGTACLARSVACSAKKNIFFKFPFRGNEVFFLSVGPQLDKYAGSLAHCSSESKQQRKNARA